MQPESAHAGSSHGRSRLLTDAFIVVFLAIQLLVPLRGIVHDKLQSRADFSWNMYSKRYSCRVDYDVVAVTGRRTSIDHRDFFYPRRSRAMKVFHRESLPWFHAYLCRRAAQSRLGDSIHGDVECAINNGEYVQLVAPEVDLCTAPGYGVIGP